jgi:hypothetical protein
MTDQVDFDPTQWDGDPELLEPHTELLLNDQDLCDVTFASKHEAFVTGFGAGQRETLALRSTGE